MRKRILPLILIIIALALISYFTYDYITDRTAKDTNIIEASGIIEVKTVTLNATTGARLIEAGYEEGNSIEKDEIAARMDDALIEKQIELTRASIDAAQTQIEAAQLQYNQGIETAEEAVEESGSIKEYTSTYNHFIYYDEPLTITESTSETSSTSTTESKSPIQGNTETDSDSSSTSNSVSYAGSAQKQSVRIQLQQAINQYNMALLKLKQAKENNISIKIAENNLSIARAQLELYNEQLNELNITTPIKGIILNKLAEEGEYLLPGTPVYEIGNLYNVTCSIYVPEDNYGKIFLNQKATLAVDSYPDMEFTGTVTKISNKAEFTPKNIQTKEERVTTVYKITISIENPELQLKPGMPVDVVIDI
ncbi:MAG: efflux RND transporter periplasmic adaptor subunit [Actinomycetota bacterium]|nr:efflux RND transporter periplasmic adaptor subunit [Actinomycetota bacterium]